MGGSTSRGVVGFPAEATSFVDRRHEVAEARRVLATTRLLTLTGPGGVGKSRLAARLAHQVVRGYGDGVWLVPLAAVQDEALVPHAVADALGIHDESGRPPSDVLAGHLRPRRLLLVLDNCEHLLGACASLVTAVLGAAPDVQVLATSRHRLGLPGEHLLAVHPLRTPDPAAPPAGGSAGQFPALQLFADRAAAVVPGFTITDGNRAAVARVCRRLDGLPLAIELAAVRIRVLDVEQLDARLDDRFRLLTTGSPVAHPRHQALRSAVDWSHDLCTPQEQLAWARLAVCVGGFDLAAAGTICAGEGVEPADVPFAVQGLVEKSILVREGSNGTSRYRLLATLRDYGLERLAARGEVDEVRHRYRDHFQRLAEEHGRRWFGPDQTAIVTRLRTDQDNLRAALDHCLATPEGAHRGLRLVSDLWFYWAARGAWVEGRHWWQRLLLRAGGRAPGAPTRTVWLTALMPTIHSRSNALLLNGPAPEPTLGLGELPTVKPLADLVTGGRQSPQEQLGFHVLNRVELAGTLTFHGRPERAVPVCTDALAACEAYGEQWARSYVLRALATARWAQGEHEEAAEAARRCLRLEYVTHEPYAVGRTLEVLAAVAASQEDGERAAVLRGAAQRVWHDIGHDPLGRHRAAGQVPVSERLARAALGDPGYEAAHRHGRELSTPQAVAYALGRRPGQPARPAPAPAAAGGLTRRELEVAALVAQGLTNRQIAETLVISRRTAEGHVDRILGKLGLTGRSQVAVWLGAQEGEELP